MKHVFIFVGDPKTGKTILGNLIKHENTIVIDDLPNIKNLGKLGFERRFPLLHKYDYVIYITNIGDNINLIKKQYPDTPVSVCEFWR